MLCRVRISTAKPKCQAKGTYLERSLQLRVPLDRLRHGVVGQLVCEHDRARSVERPVLRAGDEVLVVLVDLRAGDVGAGRANLPVVGVVLPHDSGQVEPLGDCADAVINIAVGRAPAFGRDADDELDCLHRVP